MKKTRWKELQETGLYYYGARYYNPRLSIWYGVDPLAVYNPVMESEFYGDGQHNGGVFFWGNLNPYIYTYQNPARYIDPNGKQTEAPASKGYRPGIPIPLFKRGNYYTPFPPLPPLEKKVGEGFDRGLQLQTLSILAFTAVTIKVVNEEFDIVKTGLNILFSDKLAPQTDYTGNKKHGVNWKPEDALSRAIKEKIPQGKWGSQEDLDYAGEKAVTLDPGKKLKNGKNSPGQFQDFPINPGSTSTVYYPDGTLSKPDKIRIRNNGDGKFYGFPIDSKTAKPIK